jgi:hypothetical protein
MDIGIIIMATMATMATMAINAIVFTSLATPEMRGYGSTLSIKHIGVIHISLAMI